MTSFAGTTIFVSSESFSVGWNEANNLSTKDSNWRTLFGQGTFCNNFQPLLSTMYCGNLWVCWCFSQKNETIVDMSYPYTPYNSPSYTSVYLYLIMTDLEERIEYLRTQIVPTIDALMRQGKRKSLGEIYTRLRQESEEFYRALTQSQAPVTCVAEIADLIYYSTQANEYLLQQALDVAQAFGLSSLQALDASIAKYRCRIRGIKDYAGEEQSLADYLKAQELGSFNYPAATQQLQSFKKNLRN